MFNHELYQKRFAPLCVGRHMSLYFVAVLCSEKASPWILPPNFESVNENLTVLHVSLQGKHFHQVPTS